MAHEPVLAYLHGVGGVRPGWAEGLLGAVSNARIIAPSYASVFAEETPSEETLSEEARSEETPSEEMRSDSPAATRPHPVDATDRSAYLRRQRDLADRIAQCNDVVPQGVAWPVALPRPERWPITQVLDSPVRHVGGLDQARRYLQQPRLRARVVDHLRARLSIVLTDQPGSTVIIGHSLGAIVALDLLAELDHPIDLLVTIGAPLGHPDIAERLADRGVDVSRLGGWVNVVHLADPIAFGRGAAGMFPAAVDAYLPVLAGEHGVRGLFRGMARAATAHLDSTYLSSDVVRTVVADALLSPGLAGARR